MSLGFILLIVLLVLMVGAAPRWGYSRSWGLWPAGGLGIVFIILLFLILAGRL